MEHREYSLAAACVGFAWLAVALWVILVATRQERKR